MVAIQTRLDDVLLALKGKKVEATHKLTISIPGALREDGKVLRREVDISDEGEREWERYVERNKKKRVELGDEMAKVLDVRVEARAAKPRPAPSARSEQQQVPDQSNSSHLPAEGSIAS